MAWPIVMFHGEVVHFEWKCADDETHETLAKGNVTYLCWEHRGGCCLKTEQLTFYRDNVDQFHYKRTGDRNRHTCVVYRGRER
jgi:hypothetical protein